MTDLCERLVQAAANVSAISHSNLLFEARRCIADLKKEKLKQDAELRTKIKTINEALELALTDLVKSDICVGELEAQIKAVKALPVYYIATGEIAPKDEFSVHIMIKPFELDKALE